MFERFTKEARAAVTAGQGIARDTSTRTVDTRHLLVALARDAGPARAALAEAGVDATALADAAMAELRASGLDPDALAGIGIDLAAVRREADRTFGADALERAARRRGGHLPFTSDAKKSLELALREAIRLKHRSIDGRHLLLGILRADCPGRAMLAGQDADLDALRAAAERPAAA